MATFTVVPSEPQLRYVKALCRRLNVPEHLLDNHCVQRFGKPFNKITMSECSLLIDELKDWTALPADMQRAMGQQDLF